MQGYNSSNGKGLSLLGALRRRWPIIVITMVIAGGAAAAFAFATNKDYESTATLVFRQTIAPQLNSIGLIPNTVAADNLAEDNRERVASKAVAVDASEALAARGVDMSPADVQDDVTVVGDKTSDVVKVTASADDAQRAALLANVYAESAKRLASDEDRELARMALASLRRQFDALPTNVQNHVSGPGAQLRNNMQKMQVIADVGNGSPQIVQPGYVPVRQERQPRHDDSAGRAARRRAGQRPRPPARSERSPPPRRGGGRRRLRRAGPDDGAAPSRTQAAGAVRGPAARGGRGVPDAPDEPALRLGRAGAQPGADLFARRRGQDDGRMEPVLRRLSPPA